MIFRQLFEQVSGAYSYLLASRPGGEALIIDPVLEKVDRYLQLARELDPRLLKAVDAHPRGPHHRTWRVARSYPLHHRDG
jgi:sulfur dioxygenase